MGLCFYCGGKHEFEILKKVQKNQCYTFFFCAPLSHFYSFEPALVLLPSLRSIPSSILIDSGAKHWFISWISVKKNPQPSTLHFFPLPSLCKCWSTRLLSSCAYIPVDWKACWVNSLFLIFIFSFSLFIFSFLLLSNSIFSFQFTSIHLVWETVIKWESVRRMNLKCTVL